MEGLKKEEAVDKYVQVNNQSNWANLSPASTWTIIDSGKVECKRLYSIIQTSMGKQLTTKCSQAPLQQEKTG